MKILAALSIASSVLYFVSILASITILLINFLLSLIPQSVGFWIGCYVNLLSNVQLHPKAPCPQFLKITINSV